MTLEAKALCHHCIGDTYLSREIERKGKNRTCDYCGNYGKSYVIGDLADRVEEVFNQHYTRTSDQPNGWQMSLLSDRESDYNWEREGEAVVYAIMNSADMPEKAAHDIQQILEDRHGDFDAAAMGEETAFSSETYYEEKGSNDLPWQTEWAAFERSLMTEARFFSQAAASHLASVFEGLESLKTRDGRPMIVDAGPGTELEALHRARVFQSFAPLEQALGRPDLHLGPPPSRAASAGRMNARGISVFYGATHANVAVAEVRPPVGAQVAVARFKITRPLRLLDLTALGAVGEHGSVYDPTLAGRLERAVFLRSLGQRMTRPVMPDDEAFDYLPTQAVADFLATGAAVPLDGIIFPSVQSAGDARNVVLFHKAARVEALNVPQDTVIEARSGSMSEDGYEIDYVVTEEVPPAKAPTEDDNSAWPSPTVLHRFWDPADLDRREAALQIEVDAVTVHHVESVQYATDSYKVRRVRWVRSESEF